MDKPIQEKYMYIGFTISYGNDTMDYRLLYCLPIMNYIYLDFVIYMI